MRKLALDGLALRGQSGTLAANVSGTTYGPLSFTSFGPDEETPTMTSILHVDLLLDTNADEVGDTGLSGVDVIFTVDGVDSTIPTDASGRASLSFQTSNASDTVAVQVPPHVIQASGNSAGLLPVSANSVFDEVNGTYTIELTSGHQVALTGAYFGVAATMTLLSRSNLMINPESLILSAEAVGFPGVASPNGQTYDPRIHIPEYFWTFGDTRSFSALEKTFGAIDQANHAYGAKVEHTYDTSGVKTPQVTVTKWHNGYLLQAEASLTLTINDQDALFTGANTFFIDPDGDYTTAPAGAVGYTNFNTAQGALNGRSTPTRVMFRDGKTHALSPADQWRSSHPTLYMTSQKTGSKPVLSYVAPSSGVTVPWSATNYDPDQNKDMVWDDLDIRGTWDSATETGDNIRMYLGADDKPSYALMHDCALSGFNIIAQVNDTERGHFSMTHCDVSEWAAFGSLCSSKYFAFRGNRVARRLDALSGGAKFQDHNDHGCIRANGQIGIVMQNDMFNRSGWFPNNFSINGTALYTQQPCLRLGTAMVAGAYYNVQQNTMEGGFEVMHISPANPAPLLVEAMNYQVERNLMVGSWMTNIAFRTFYGGGSIRNNVYVSPNTDRTHTNDTVAFVSTGFASQNNPHAAENLSAPVLVAHNTIINLLSDANSKSGSGAIPTVTEVHSNHAFTGFTQAHNILHEPALNTANVPDAPLDLLGIYASRMTTPYQTNVFGPIAGSTTPLDTPTLGIPQTGSAAIGAVQADPLTVTDILGNPRMRPDTRGAAYVA